MKTNLFLLLIFIGSIFYGYVHSFSMASQRPPSSVKVLSAYTQVESKKETVPTVQEIYQEFDRQFDFLPVRLRAKMWYVISLESGFRLTAMNWNCKYGDKFTSCKKGDEDKAWSVDCGIMQYNFPGKYCPGHLIDWKNNLKLGAEKYKREGIGAWVASWDL